MGWRVSSVSESHLPDTSQHSPLQSILAPRDGAVRSDKAATAQLCLHPAATWTGSCHSPPGTTVYTLVVIEDWSLLLTSRKCVLPLKTTIQRPLRVQEGTAPSGVHMRRRRRGISGFLNLHCSFAIILDGRKFSGNWHIPSSSGRKVLCRGEHFWVISLVG